MCETPSVAAPSFSFSAPRSSNPPSIGGFSFGTGTSPVRSTGGFSFGTGETSSNFAISTPTGFSFGTSEPLTYSSDGYRFSNSGTSNAPQ
jgi:hypothetical protein